LKVQIHNPGFRYYFTSSPQPIVLSGGHRGGCFSWLRSIPLQAVKQVLIPVSAIPFNWGIIFKEIRKFHQRSTKIVYPTDSSGQGIFKPVVAPYLAIPSLRQPSPDPPTGG